MKCRREGGREAKGGLLDPSATVVAAREVGGQSQVRVFGEGGRHRGAATRTNEPRPRKLCGQRARAQVRSPGSNVASRRVAPHRVVSTPCLRAAEGEVPRRET